VWTQKRKELLFSQLGIEHRLFSLWQPLSQPVQVLLLISNVYFVIIDFPFQLKTSLFCDRQTGVTVKELYLCWEGTLIESRLSYRAYGLRNSVLFLIPFRPVRGMSRGGHVHFLQNPFQWIIDLSFNTVVKLSTNFHSRLYLSKYQVRDEAPNLETQEVIMCCLRESLAHLKGPRVMSMEQWWVRREMGNCYHTGRHHIPDDRQPCENLNLQECLKVGIVDSVRKRHFLRNEMRQNSVHF
jgi:hypothetical protein